MQQLFKITLFIIAVAVVTSWSRSNVCRSSSVSRKFYNSESYKYIIKDSLTTLYGINPSTAAAALENEKVIEFPPTLSDEWELDCYSRPVVNEDGKKLWEILITDSVGDFRFLKAIPSSLVNSRNLRNIIEEVIDLAPVRPRTIRFFRGQMLNMISIALSTLEVEVKPSRQTPNLFMWLAEREKGIYPLMPGYSPQLRQGNILDFEVSQPERLPDLLKAESYAFVALPAEAFWNKEITSENIKKGRLTPMRELPQTGWVHGITLFSRRADSIAAWMQGLEISHLKADLLTRELVLNLDVNLQYIIAPLSEAQKREAQVFEKGRSTSSGYHFLSVQFSPDSEDVEGFWLLREFTGAV